MFPDGAGCLSGCLLLAVRCVSDRLSLKLACVLLIHVVALAPSVVILQFTTHRLNTFLLMHLPSCQVKKGFSVCIQ